MGKSWQRTRSRKTHVLAFSLTPTRTCTHDRQGENTHTRAHALAAISCVCTHTQIRSLSLSHYLSGTHILKKNTLYLTHTQTRTGHRSDIKNSNIHTHDRSLTHTHSRTRTHTHIQHNTHKQTYSHLVHSQAQKGKNSVPQQQPAPSLSCWPLL